MIINTFTFNTRDLTEIPLSSYFTFIHKCIAKEAKKAWKKSINLLSIYLLEPDSESVEKKASYRIPFSEKVWIKGPENFYHGPGIHDYSLTVKIFLPLDLYISDQNLCLHKPKAIYLGELPFLTENGTFVVDGVERVIISQIIKKPGIYFMNKGAVLISDNGRWTVFSQHTVNQKGLKLFKAFTAKGPTKAEKEVGNNQNKKISKELAYVNTLGELDNYLIKKLQKNETFSSKTYSAESSRFKKFYSQVVSDSGQLNFLKLKNEIFDIIRRGELFYCRKRISKAFFIELVLQKFTKTARYQKREDEFYKFFHLETHKLLEEEDSNYIENKTTSPNENGSLNETATLALEIASEISENINAIDSVILETEEDLEALNEEFISSEGIELIEEYEDLLDCNIENRVRYKDVLFDTDGSIFLSDLIQFSKECFVENDSMIRLYSRADDFFEIKERIATAKKKLNFLYLIEKTFTYVECIRFAIERLESLKKNFYNKYTNSRSKLELFKTFNDASYLIKKVRNLIAVIEKKELPLLIHFFNIKANNFCARKVKNISDSLKNIFQKQFVLGEVTRNEINKKLNIKVSHKTLYFTFQDIARTVYILSQSNRVLDDIDNLKNKEVRNIGELLSNAIKVVFDATSIFYQWIEESESPESNPLDLERNPLQVIMPFLKTNELSQFLDETNPLAEVAHKRKLSVFGPNGLNRSNRAKNIRDIHPSTYEKICPIETPEGERAGLISSLSIYTHFNTNLKTLETPHFEVWNTYKGTFPEKTLGYRRLRFNNSINVQKCGISFSALSNQEPKNRPFLSGIQNGKISTVKFENINFAQISPTQTFSVAISMVPFMEHNDGNRALMGANMQRQAVPLLYGQKPIVGTGFEGSALMDSDLIILAPCEGVITLATTNVIQIVDKFNQVLNFPLIKFQTSNQEICFNQKPNVWIGDHVYSNQIIAGSQGTQDGELALGTNLNLNYVPWEGYNFEDAIIISRKLVTKHVLTTLHVSEQEQTFDYLDYTIKYKQEIAKNNSKNSRVHPLNFDENGIIKIGSHIAENDVLINQITPEATVLSPVNKLLSALFPEDSSVYKIMKREYAIEDLVGFLPYDLYMIIKKLSKKLQSEMSDYLTVHELLEIDIDPMFLPNSPLNADSFIQYVPSPLMAEKYATGLVSNIFILDPDYAEKGNIFLPTFLQKTVKNFILNRSGLKRFNPRVIKSRKHNFWHKTPNKEFNIKMCATLKLAVKRCSSIFDEPLNGLRLIILKQIPEVNETSEEILLEAIKLYKKTRPSVCESILFDHHTNYEGLYFENKSRDFIFGYDGIYSSDIDYSNLKAPYESNLAEFRNLQNIIKNYKTLVDKKFNRALGCVGLRFYEMSIMVYGIRKQLDYLNNTNRDSIYSKSIFDYSHFAANESSYTLIAFTRDFDLDYAIKKKSETRKRVFNETCIFLEKYSSLVYKIIRVYIAKISKIEVGDKLSGRHGNKGVISRILPEQDCPTVQGSHSIDVICNPLGVPSRMNVGQLFECLLGSALDMLKDRAKVVAFDEIYGREASRLLINQKLNEAAFKTNIAPLFFENAIGKTYLQSGYLGTFFDNTVTLGKAYILKLIHMVGHKVHSRTTGPYSAITEQPLRGRRNSGGQRVGEMEIWALEAIGSSTILKEILTIRSSSIEGRGNVETYFSLEPYILSCFPDVILTLTKELNSLGLDLTLFKLPNQYTNTFAQEEAKLEDAQLLNDFNAITKIEAVLFENIEKDIEEMFLSFEALYR